MMNVCRHLFDFQPKEGRHFPWDTDLEDMSDVHLSEIGSTIFSFNTSMAFSLNDTTMSAIPIDLSDQHPLHEMVDWTGHHHSLIDM